MYAVIGAALVGTVRGRGYNNSCIPTWRDCEVWTDLKQWGEWDAYRNSWGDFGTYVCGCQHNNLAFKLACASFHGNMSVVGEWIKEHKHVGSWRIGCGITSMHIAAAQGHADVLRLLKDKYETNLKIHRDIRGQTELHYAVATDQHETVVLLIDENPLQIVIPGGPQCLSPMQLANYRYSYNMKTIRAEKRRTATQMSNASVKYIGKR